MADAHRELNGWLRGLLASAALVATVTGIIFLLKAHVPVLGLSVLYLFAALPIAVFWGLALAVLVSIASMLAFNFFFPPPTYSFHAPGFEQLVRARSVPRDGGRGQRPRRTLTSPGDRVDAPGRDLRLPPRAWRAQRVETGRTPTHALRRLWEAERFDRIVAPAPAGRGHGFTPKELQWILVHAPSETLILRPDPTLAQGARLARELEAVA